MNFLLLFLISNDIRGVESTPNAEMQCGGIALHRILKCSDPAIPLDRVLTALPDDGRNSSLAELARVAQDEFGMSCTALDWEESPPPASAPAIIPIAGRKRVRHFVAVTAWGRAEALVENGSQRGVFRIADLRRGGWDGTALHIAQSQEQLTGLLPQWWSSPAVRWRAAGVVFLATVILLLLPRRTHKFRNPLK